MTTTNTWFSVDKEGLCQLLDGRTKAFALFELLQNAWDTDAQNVSVTLEKLPRRPFAELTVIDDDPRGFHDLSHAYTLFANSQKKGNPKQRGRFNIGEKLVLALCKSARVESTTGTVNFHENGRMTHGRKRTSQGSVFQAVIRMTQEEFEEACAEICRVIPPTEVKTMFNGTVLERACSGRDEVASFEATLATVIADAEGTLRPTRRKTRVEVYDTAGEPGWLYELGIPVVQTGDRWHVNVLQKVPLNMNRDNVTPGYLRRLRAEVLNATAARLSSEESKEPWVTEALEDDAVSDTTVVQAIEKMYGKKRVIYDPSDVEASQNAMAKNYTVIHGGALSKRAWAAVRRSQAALPAGQVLPTFRPYSTDPNAKPRKEIPRERWSEGMREVEKLTCWLAAQLEVEPNLEVCFVVPRGPKSRKFLATWGAGVFEWNVTALGKAWFDAWPDHIVDLFNTVLHELSHNAAKSHLDDAFHRACTAHGANAMLLMLVHGARMPFVHRVLAKYAAEKK